ncbi:hypothetical protein Psta_3307 [Pirellula staleyi DSM 6068]|uniref:Uncharacterized protein n=1 Tax=Pirellula staleyi (strain ATCC 27377 / DSM 6068 / ICPB 4128) TaxID=530564 RepID=D2QXD1_PIRSD|nr:hypothetical protein [Pirellula staleyi]ADB17971.1 hypothetical protein Psta_3307 [Pirellula staleyi DSM 6068]
MARSILEAIKQGEWDFEPKCADDDSIEATGALPGSTEKLSVLAERLAQGLPLWHPSDRRSYNDADRE